MQRPFLLFLLAALCALAGGLIPTSDPAHALEVEAAQLQQRVIERHAELRLVAQAIATSPDEHAEVASGISWWLFRGDSLLRWSGTSLLSDDSARALIDGHVRIGASVFLSARIDGAMQVRAIAELWNAPPFSNSYLRPAFHRSLRAAPGLIAAQVSDTGQIVRDENGAALFHLAWADRVTPMVAMDRLRIVLMLLAVVLVVFLCWSWCSSLATGRGAWAAAFVFFLTVAALRCLSLWLYPIAPFDRLPLFGPELYAASRWLPSLGDLLIDAVLLVIIARFTHRRLRDAGVPHGHGSIITPFFFTITLLAFGWWITQAFIGLVEDSSVDLDLFHLQDLNAYSAVALSCIALLFAAWALLADAFARTIAARALERVMLSVMLMAVIAAVSVQHIAGFVDMILVLWPVPVLALLLHGRARSYALGHALIGISVLAFVGAHVLIKYTEHRVEHERLALAERLVTSDDPVVELLFRETAPRLRNDPAVYALLNDTLPCDAAALEQRVRQEYFTGYWERYDVRLYAFDALGRERCATSTEAPRSLSNETHGFARTIAAVDMPELFIDASPGQRTFYHARVAVMAADTTPPAQLVIELHPRITPEGSGFPELLLNDADGISRRTARYAFARYEGGTLIEQRGFTFPLTWSRTPDVGSARRELRGMDLLAYGDPTRSLVVLGTPVLRWIDRATTFSWLFAFFGIALALALVVRAMIVWRGVPPLGIGMKVRVALLAFAVLGLVLFSLGAQRLLTRLYGERNDAALLSTSRSMVTELTQKLDGAAHVDRSQAAYLDRLLVKLSNVFFTDANLYTLDGRLLSTSRPQVFASALLGRRMNATAFAALASGGSNGYVQDERIGGARYRSAYLPLRDNSGNTVAWINLPSFARQGEIDGERDALFTAIINLLVLLLALSLLAGIFISGWTTRPLGLLQRGLSRIALQGANEPIAYSGRDEVGELVKVYNRKVEELRDSAEKLARSERESAWKEMARQVAHEIKNPLTPMRLSVQHFEGTWNAEAPDAKEKLERFTSGMVQQIDALSRIAGEFSAFAQMPQPQPTVFDLREVAQAGVALFSGEPDADISLVANEALMVKADREHLLRALNNLLKNALQSIPEGRRGKVEVALRRDGDEAVLSVRDNGSGIPEEARERIFTPSFTTKSSGMGLGLAMVKRITEQAGGRVWFDTRLGERTCFFIELPLVAA